MREFLPPAPVTVEFLIHNSSATVSAPATSCDANTCPWWPYSNSRDFKINTALVLAFLVCSVLFALALNIAIRYITALNCFRRRRREEERDRKIEEVAWRIYSEEMKSEAVCAICLSEVAVGERISVSENCNHGFHVDCIQRWLASHSSCPTCRAKCRPPPQHSN